MKHVRTITALLLFSAMGLSGCDQAKELATEAAEIAKKEVVSEIGKAVNGGGDQAEKEDGPSSKETDKEENEEK